MALKLNLGCGRRQLEGYVNIDSVAAFAPDRVIDLEHTPWDLDSDCAEHVLLNHVLEHLGADPATFLAVMQELYRVCRDGATLQINVPHPLHLHYRTDPSHVRMVTPQTLAMFSWTECDQAAAAGSPMTPWAHILAVDFSCLQAEYVPDAGTVATLTARGLLQPGEDPRPLAEIIPNLIEEIRIVLQVHKPVRRAAAA